MQSFNVYFLHDGAFIKTKSPNYSWLSVGGWAKYSHYLLYGKNGPDALIWCEAHVRETWL